MRISKCQSGEEGTLVNKLSNIHSIIDHMLVYSQYHRKTFFFLLGQTVEEKKRSSLK